KFCKVPLYWYEGFLSVQSSIDAAVIEMKTNRSVWEEMKSISGVRLQSPSIKPVYKLDYIWFIIYAVLCFSPYMYFLSVKVIREKKKLKVLMKAMGLQDLAFWLSWSLLYTIYISIMASLMTAITINGVTLDRNFLEMYFFYFFYGIASIHFCFMLSSLLKQPNIASFVGFVLHFIFGLLGFMTIFEKVPPSLEWIFNLFSPFTFIAGMSEQKLQKSALPPHRPRALFCSCRWTKLSCHTAVWASYFTLFASDLGKYGVPYPSAFFLRPSYWLQRGSQGAGLRAGSHQPVPGCDTEPMPPGFEGKDAISIYEGQITALLGHSGSGKTALLNLLSGFSKPSAGSATIYNYKVSEVQDMEGIQAMVGICPQFNLHFETLTVKENLRLFAHIKGIQWKETEQEVQKVLVQLDLTGLQDIHADALSGRQKRKLSLAIAILGNPQVLLLDEPTAGLDPCSRHHVWSLLKERQPGRVILFTTQSMDEADTHAGEGSPPAPRGVWACWAMRINDACDPEVASSLVRQYIPDAVFKGRSGDELCYLLPLENTDSFPDLFGHLDSGFLQGVVNYEVSRTTLADVFLKLEGKRAFDHEGKTLIPLSDGDLEERDQSLEVHPEVTSPSASGMALWRQQVCAVMRIRFLKLKHEGKLLRALLLMFGVFILPMLMLVIGFHLWDSSRISELTARFYFHPTGSKIQSKLTNLLIFNDTGEEGHVMLVRFLYRYTLMCGAEPINCFPVLVNILSNSFLRLFNSTARIRIWSNPLSFVSILNGVWGPAKLPSFSSLPSQVKARAQLRLAGLFPSAYWCGQALVDVPFFWALLCIMFGIILLFSHSCPLHSSTILPMIVCTTGYGFSLILLTYLIAFKCRKGRSNRYLWSFIFILVRKVNLHSKMFDFHTLPLEVALQLICLTGQEESFYSHSISLQEAVIVVNSLRKEYEDKKACSMFKKKKKVAVRNLSFSVKKGEVLGLLGPNGSGKSTVMHMISGDMAVTAGEVGGRSSWGNPDGGLGHCPQEDALWPELSVRQHLEAHAAVRGMRKEDAAVLISRLAKDLDLQKHLNTPARRLPAGEARKLCFALSILGNPTVMLWDEPSVGMDVKGQRSMETAVRSKARAAILSTRSLEEAALCDRVAVLVAGQLRYIGSLEELRGRFGTSYHLEVKLKDAGQSDAIHTEILRLFPHAARQERSIYSLLSYKIPMEDALPLSQSFSKLEAAKQNFRLEEYSLSLHTLQQVFLDLTSDLEEPDLEAAPEGAVEKRLLQP
uniref:ABC transporter domain-containing protein n=1 Tax=Anas zonorhyncha TaxID=75864 RepID=A0A8B9TZL3_9AVES